MYFHFWTYFSDTQLYLQSIFVLSNVVQVVRIRNAVKDTFKTQVDFCWTLKPEINFHPLHSFKLIIRIFVRIFFPWASRSRAIGHRIHRCNCVVNWNVKAIATFVTLWHSYMSQNNVLRGCRRFIFFMDQLNRKKNRKSSSELCQNSAWFSCFFLLIELRNSKIELRMTSEQFILIIS